MPKPWYLFVLVLILSTPGWCEPVAIIVHKSNPIDNMGLKTLEEIYKGKKQFWEDGEKILAVNRPIKSQIRGAFYNIVLKSKPSASFFRPGTPIPISHILHKTPRSVKRFVSRVEGAIGYIYLNEVDDTVKLLRVNDFYPSDENIKSGNYIIQTLGVVVKKTIKFYAVDYQ